jgi:hypothetical protein
MLDYHIVISLFKPAKTSTNTFIPTSLFESLPVHSHLVTPNIDPTPLEASLISARAPKDYRLGFIGVNWVDFISKNESSRSEIANMKRTGINIPTPFIF